MDGMPAHTIPGQINTFIEFNEEDISKIQHFPHVSRDTPHFYAMIEPLNGWLLLSPKHMNKWWPEAEDNNERQEHHWNNMAPNLCLVPVDTI